MLRSVFDDKEEVASVGASALGEEILEDCTWTRCQKLKEALQVFLIVRALRRVLVMILLRILKAKLLRHFTRIRLQIGHCFEIPDDVGAAGGDSESV